MLEHVRYERPPVREMTCEFRFAGPGWDATVPGLVYRQLEDLFPVRETGQRVSLAPAPAELGARPTKVVEVAQVVRFKQDDGLAFVQLGANLISFHRTAPYPGWNGLKPTIDRVFEAYRLEAKPESLTRVGLRYLNDFHFPQESVDVEDYFNFYPTIGETLPQNYSDLQTSCVLLLGDEAAVRLQLHAIPAVGDAKTSLRLDLDHFPAVDHVPSLDHATGWAERAHTELRGIFEASVKPATTALFGHRTVVSAT